MQFSEDSLLNIIPRILAGTSQLGRIDSGEVDSETLASINAQLKEDALELLSFAHYALSRVVTL